MIYEIEKSMTDLGDEVTEDEKADINAKIEKLKASMTTDDVEAIKADFEALTNAFQPLAQKLYSKGQAEQGPQDMGQGPDDNVDEADYEVVD